MKRLVSGAAAIAACVLASSIVLAQAPEGAARGQGQGGGRGAAAPMTNLQVFPKDTPAPQVLQAMQAFSAALGVTCEHCHVFLGRGNPGNDMASDMKPTKNIARAMMRMVQQINPAVAAAVPTKAADQVARVGCATCHRGATIPMVAPGSPGAPPAPPAGGAPGGAPGAGRGN